MRRFGCLVISGGIILIAGMFALKPTYSEPVATPYPTPVLFATIAVTPYPSPTPLVFNLTPEEINAIRVPYGEEYIVSQGTHGEGYGHRAIDLSGNIGGKENVPVLSPINGRITGNYIDQYQNTTLIIINPRYVVTLVHGNFNLPINTNVKIGDMVGTEGNNGYVFNLKGVLCSETEDPTKCGFHTHINIFDRNFNTNLNLMELFWPGAENYSG